MFFFAGMILTITFTTGINAFLTFTMSSTLSAIALMMLGISILLDLVVFWNILVILIACILKSASICKCSHWKLSIGGWILKEIRNMMKDVIKGEDGQSD